MRFIDVSVRLDDRLPVYPGNPPLSFEAVKRRRRGDSSNVSAVRLSVHAGTHVDAPRHFFDDGSGAEALPIDLLIGPARVVEVLGGSAIDVAALSGLDFSDDVRLLLKTTNSNLWSSPEFHSDYLGLTDSAARHLIAQGIRVVGVDYLSVEPYKTPGAPTHHTLLQAGVIIVEGLDLSGVEPGAYEMICLPLRLVGSDGAPARVVLRRR